VAFPLQHITSITLKDHRFCHHGNCLCAVERWIAQNPLCSLVVFDLNNAFIPAWKTDTDRLKQEAVLCLKAIFRKKRHDFKNERIEEKNNKQGGYIEMNEAEDL